MQKCMLLTMDHIATLLPKVLRKRGIKDEAEASLVAFTADRWFTAFAPDIVPQVQVTKFMDRTLFLKVESSIAAQECYARNEELLLYLRKEFPAIPCEKVCILRA